MITQRLLYCFMQTWLPASKEDDSTLLAFIIKIPPCNNLERLIFFKKKMPLHSKQFYVAVKPVSVLNGKMPV